MVKDFRHELAEIQRGLEEAELRDMHPLRVYRPTEQQLPIHESKASEVLVAGGKRAGKTLSVVCELGSRILGIPITRPDGTQIPLRFRTPNKRNPGLYWVIGLNIDHIGQTIYHRLFSEGMGCNFRIIKDLESGKWRAFDPNIDKSRYGQSCLCPPMFGPNIIKPKSWHMESQAGHVFKSVTLLNGAMICAYPSTGDSPKQGDAVDGIWIDEDIERGAFLKEWQDRLITTRGWFLWSVWPKVANQALIKTLERAEREKDNPRHPIQMFRLIGSENPYSDKEGIAEGLARMEDDDDVAHRDRGDIDAFITGRRMYDFGSHMHVLKAEKFEKPENPAQVISNLLQQNPHQLPAEWTRYLVIDPSHTCTACLVGVVPPPDYPGCDMDKRLIIEKEIIGRKMTPTAFVDMLARQIGSLRFEAFIMDQMAGRQTTIGSDVTVFRTYEEHFRRCGLISRVTRYGFMRGCADKSLRRRDVRDLLEPTYGGFPRLFVSYRCPQTIKQMYEFRKKEIKDQDGNSIPTDDGVNERIYDAVICVEYISAYITERFRQDTAYMPPEVQQSRGSMAFSAAMALRAEKDKNDRTGYVHLGPGAYA